MKKKRSTSHSYTIMLKVTIAIGGELEGIIVYMFASTVYYIKLSVYSIMHRLPSQQSPCRIFRFSTVGKVVWLKLDTQHYK